MNKLNAFNGIRAFLLTHVKSERGATAVEYALLIGLIAVVIGAAITIFQGDISGMFNKAGADVG